MHTARHSPRGLQDCKDWSCRVPCEPLICLCRCRLQPATTVKLSPFATWHLQRRQTSMRETGKVHRTEKRGLGCNWWPRTGGSNRVGYHYLKCSGRNSGRVGITLIFVDSQGGHESRSRMVSQWRLPPYSVQRTAYSVENRQRNNETKQDRHIDNIV